MDAMDEASAAEAEVLALRTKIEEKRKRLREIREEEETTEREVRELQEALEKALERREKAVKEREERMRQAHERVEEAAEKAKGRVNLDVGGRVFSFTTETLAKYPESFFGRLVSGRWENKDKGKKKRKAEDEASECRGRRSCRWRSWSWAESGSIPKEGPTLRLEEWRAR